MKSRRNYDRAANLVRDIICRWDPYELIATGSPPDEFDSEVAAVVRQIPRIRSANDAAHAISRVFSSAFEAERFKPEDCLVVGTELYQTLDAHDLLKG